MSSTHPILLTLSGPAGCGKTTLAEKLAHDHRGFARVVTATTRPRRGNERNGIDYHFYSPEQMQQKIKAGEFLEWARVHSKGDDHLYGTPRQSILGPLSLGQDLVMCIDVQGARSLRTLSMSEESLWDSLSTVFIKIDLDEIMRRLRDRGTESDAEIERRIDSARTEMLAVTEYDFNFKSASRQDDYFELLRVIDKIKRRFGRAPEFEE